MKHIEKSLLKNIFKSSIRKRFIEIIAPGFAIIIFAWSITVAITKMSNNEHSSSTDDYADLKYILPRIYNGNENVLGYDSAVNEYRTNLGRKVPQLKKTLVSPVPMKQIRNYPDVRPSLSQIISGRKILGDVTWLLDYAVIGFAKCGTSSLKTWVEGNNSTFIFEKEQCSMSFDETPSRLVSKLYMDFPDDKEKLRGLKCPTGITAANSLRNFHVHFKNTKFIIGVRHPVRWFESFYNFRVRTNGGIMPPTKKLLGYCNSESNLVCTNRAMFHYFLAHLGKTPLDSNKEWDLLNHDKSYPLDSERIYRLKNLHKMMKNEKRKIFLFDIAQLEDSDAARLKTFRDDFHQFLDIEDDLLDLPHRSTGRHEDMAKSILAKQINICDNEHNKVRKVLMRIGRNASAWIRKYFLLSEDVTVSSRKYFKEIIKKWRHDPCFS